MDNISSNSNHLHSAYGSWQRSSASAGSFVSPLTRSRLKIETKSRSELDYTGASAVIKDENQNVHMIHIRREQNHRDKDHLRNAQVPEPISIRLWTDLSRFQPR